ncbi:MAG: hypothetical protein ACYTDT_13600 [Planctomycetota bacterium]
MNRLFVATGLLCAMFATSLAADSITYLAKDRTTRTAENCSVTSWSASSVKYKGADGKDVTLARRDVLSIDRMYGTMGSDLMDAVETAKFSIDDAIIMFDAAIKNGNALDKEEASYLKAFTLEQSSATNKADRAHAVAAYKAYTSKHKAGYFAETAWEVLAGMQSGVSAKRTTLTAMAKADSALSYKGNLLLGQLESSEGKWAAAKSAFKSAQSSAGAYKGSKHRATAWLGYVTYKGGDAAAAKSMLEPIVADKKFVDGEAAEHEMALAVAYPALGDIHLDSKTYAKAYDAYMQGAFYCWWVGNKTQEGFSLGQAWLCTKKLKSSGEKWEQLHGDLKQALSNGFPAQKARVEAIK